MQLRALLIFIGTILVVAAFAVMILGLIEVGQGEKGTWEIWPYYIIHGVVSLVGLVLYGIANRGRERPAMAAPEGGEGS
jgi:NADH:ubiquinone oxidoreductase subunit 6 (subunit J)